MRLSDFLQNVGQPFPYYPSLARIIGMQESVFLCRLIWWTGLEKRGDGWIYKTMAELEAETGMTRREQETARRNLRERGLVEERHERLKHKMLYRVDTERLNNLWESANIPECPNPPFGEGATSHSSGGATSHSSISTKETQKRLTEDAAAASPVVPPTDLKAKKAEFTRLWTEAYRAKLGYAYHFTQRDTKALNELLPSVEDIAALADEFRGAWQLTGPRHWHCERAITVHYFAGHLNEIRREMKKTGTEGERKF